MMLRYINCEITRGKEFLTSEACAEVHSQLSCLLSIVIGRVLSGRITLRGLDSKIKKKVYYFPVKSKTYEI